MSRSAIALLITLFFLMAITISIGVGLKYINTAKGSISDENFLLQTSVIIDDVLTFLKESPELKMVKENDELFDVFLMQSEFIPLDIAGLKVGVSIKSARSKVNINTMLKDANLTEHFRTYISGYNINPAYVDMLEDSVSTLKDLEYYQKTSFLNEKPEIFREHIASYAHLQEINEFYKKTYFDNALANIDFKDLFYVQRTNTSYCIDSYYVTDSTKEMLEGINKDDAQNFVVDMNTSLFKDYYCSDDKNRKFLDINIEIIQNEKTANISFEYDIQQAKGYNFSYEI
jgi:hypothetical protein